MTDTKSLAAAFAGAVKMIGAEMAAAVCNTFGSTNGRTDDVPENRRGDLLATLRRLANGGRVPLALARAAAHGPKPEEDDDDGRRPSRAAKRPTVIDAAFIAKAYRRWNNPPKAHERDYD